MGEPLEEENVAEYDAKREHDRLNGRESSIEPSGQARREALVGRFLRTPGARDLRRRSPAVCARRVPQDEAVNEDPFSSS